MRRTPFAMAAVLALGAASPSGVPRRDELRTLQERRSE
jgi:hypothetical protein